MATRDGRMTREAARAILSPLGMTLRRDGDYRVNYLGGEEATAYYTDDLDDAVETGRQMAAERPRWTAARLASAPGERTERARLDPIATTHAVASPAPLQDPYEVGDVVDVERIGRGRVVETHPSGRAYLVRIDHSVNPGPRAFSVEDLCPVETAADRRERAAYQPTAEEREALRARVLGPEPEAIREPLGPGDPDRVPGVGDYVQNHSGIGLGRVLSVDYAARIARVDPEDGTAPVIRALQALLVIPAPAGPLDRLAAEAGLRRFTRTDWYGYAGASDLPDGSEPFTGEGPEVEGWPGSAEWEADYLTADRSAAAGTIVLDGEGLAIICGPNSQVSLSTTDPERALRVARVLHRLGRLPYADLVALLGIDAEAGR